MSSKVSEKIERLVRLAVNAGATDSEARTSALIACQLIAKHGLPSAQKPNDDASKLRDIIVALSKERDELAEQLQVVVEQYEGLETEVNQLLDDLYVEKQLLVAQAMKALRRKAIITKYDGRCSSCNEVVFEGDTIAWAKGEGIICVDCWERLKRIARSLMNQARERSPVSESG